MSDAFGWLMIISVIIYLMWYLWALILTLLLSFTMIILPFLTSIVAYNAFDVSMINSIGIGILTIPVSIILAYIYARLHIGNLPDWWDVKRVEIYNNLFKRKKKK